MAARTSKTSGSARRSRTPTMRNEDSDYGRRNRPESADRYEASRFGRDAYRDDERSYGSRASGVDYDEYDDRVNRDHDERVLYSQGRRSRSQGSDRYSMNERFGNPQRDRQDYESPRGYGRGDHAYWSPSEDRDFRESEAPRGNSTRGYREEESFRGGRDDRGYSARRDHDFDEDDREESRYTRINIRNERDADEDLDEADYEESPRRGRATSSRRSTSQSRSNHR